MVPRTLQFVVQHSRTSKVNDNSISLTIRAADPHSKLRNPSDSSQQQNFTPRRGGMKTEILSLLESVLLRASASPRDNLFSPELWSYFAQRSNLMIWWR